MTCYYCGGQYHTERHCLAKQAKNASGATSSIVHQPPTMYQQPMYQPVPIQPPQQQQQQQEQQQQQQQQQTSQSSSTSSYTSSSSTQSGSLLQGQDTTRCGAAGTPCLYAGSQPGTVRFAGSDGQWQQFYPVGGDAGEGGRQRYSSSSSQVRAIILAYMQSFSQSIYLIPELHEQQQPLPVPFPWQRQQQHLPLLLLPLQRRRG